ncbi:MAG: sugar phosphate isomerase/epimerase [Puia sp.]|nr:sugar phosphate isomerase/epimerase [Puia sp.]
MSLDVLFGVSTWVWTSPFTTRSAEDLFRKISEAGFDLVEIAVEDPALIDRKAVREALDRYHLDISVCGAFGLTRDLTSEDPSVRKNSLSYISECLDLCAEWGVAFFGGPMYSAVGKARMVPAAQRLVEWERSAAHLFTVCEMAAARGLKIALEPLNRFETDLVNTVADMCRLLEDINHPAAGILLDGFHMNIEERDAEAAIVMAGDRLLHFQVSENDRGTPGSGQSDWRAYKKGLEAIGYSGAVVIESFTPENQELAGAVCFWHPKAESQDGLASEGLKFLKEWAS